MIPASVDGGCGRLLKSERGRIARTTNREGRNWDKNAGRIQKRGGNQGKKEGRKKLGLNLKTA